MHPNIETELRCGKCETPICPRCSVQSPVGMRCPACANLRRPVIYEVSPDLLLRGIGAAAGVAIAVGVLWAYLLPHALGFFGLFVFFPAAGYGWLAAEAMGRVTKRRRGSALQAVVAASCVLVYVVHNLIVAPHTPVPQNDIVGYLFVIIAAVVGIGYVR
ncbi:MAG: B-box zinc finger protein [Dehalococcoidia bacterium]